LKARRFRVVFPDGLRDRHAGLPSEAELENLTVVLAQKGGLWVPVSAADPGAPARTITLGVGAGTQVYRGDALMAVIEVIEEELNRRGIHGVFASVDERDVARGKSGPGEDVRFVLRIAEVGAGKTSRHPLPLKHGEEAQENLAKDAGILARTVASIADWDLVFRTFFDFGKTRNNDRVAGVEADHTLLGAGVGLEFQVYHPAYLMVRADLGFALGEDDRIQGREVSAGDSRLHMSVTLAW
jgi:hypothetical protein